MRGTPFEPDISLSNEEWLTVNPFWIKALSWMCIILFIYLAIMSYLTGQGHVAPVFVFFVLLGILLFLLTGKLHVNRDRIVSITPVGKYEIWWDEVHQVEIDFSGGGLVFYGTDKNKRMAVTGPKYWGRKNRQHEQVMPCLRTPE